MTKTLKLNTTEDKNIYKIYKLNTIEVNTKTDIAERFRNRIIKKYIKEQKVVL